MGELTHVWCVSPCLQSSAPLVGHRAEALKCLWMFHSTGSRQLSSVRRWSFQVAVVLQLTLFLHRMTHNIHVVCHCNSFPWDLSQINNIEFQKQIFKYICFSSELGLNVGPHWWGATTMPTYNISNNNNNNNKQQHAPPPDSIIIILKGSSSKLRPGYFFGSWMLPFAGCHGGGHAFTITHTASEVKARFNIF